ncbi:alpha/beta fold hydrolase [Mucilaginibacter terrae]|uniref:Sigma-B regulation protein RsbQ n=1 Tax=Mucilaginibacter terrae TaxID=1955052 RepID=A0ABU3GP40_9SPHI|nr:alpha/beta hydrolase [Mucilaginibacter terrae]MDT3401553.1 sigma-B regulation protein RsbQ [Mucilaginibacter terrae]
MPSTLKQKHNLSIEGNPDAQQTIIFAHGFGTDQTAWHQVKQAFKDDYRLVLYDNVGAGKSDPAAYSPIKYQTLNTYANDLLDIASVLQLENAIIVAHSVSSMIAMLAAVKAPQYFSKLVFTTASPRYLNDESEGYIGGFTQPVLDSMYEGMTLNYYAWASGFSAAAMANADKPNLGSDFAKSLLSVRPDIALSVAKVIFESDVRKELSGLNIETLLLHSQNDIAVPTEVAQYLHRNISNSRLEFLNAEGHFPHISAPDEVIKALKTFI